MLTRGHMYPISTLGPRMPTTAVSTPAGAGRLGRQKCGATPALALSMRGEFPLGVRRRSAASRAAVSATCPADQQQTGAQEDPREREQIVDDRREAGTQQRRPPPDPGQANQSRAVHEQGVTVPALTLSMRGVTLVGLVPLGKPGCQSWTRLT